MGLGRPHEAHSCRPRAWGTGRGLRRGTLVPIADELADIATRFQGFAAFSPSPLYARLSDAVAEDTEVTGLLLAAEPDQRWPMLLLAAVNLERRRLGVPFPTDAEELAEFCRRHREPLLETISRRRTQTNEVSRCAYLLPCFVHASDGRPLALIEVGASKGLVLNCDRYAYDYSGTEVGAAGSPVRVRTELRGAMPPLAPIEIASRVGIDLAPNPDEEWLRACIFSDQDERLARLDAALEIARHHPPRVVRGDALDVLPALIEEAPDDAQVLVFHTAVLAYLPEGHGESLARLARDVSYVTAEHGGPSQEFVLRVDGTEVGRAHPHARWLEWTA